MQLQNMLRGGVLTVIYSESIMCVGIVVQFNGVDINTNSMYNIYTIVIKGERNE